RHALDPVLVRIKGDLLLAGCGIPERDVAELFTHAAAAGERFAVGRKGQPENAAAGRLQRKTLFPRGHVPDFDLARMLKIDVRTIAGCQELAVRREDRLLQTVLVSVDCAHFASSDWVPDPHRAVVTGRSQPLAVGTAADGAHWLRVPLQAYRFLASGHVPQANDLIPAGAGKRLAIGRERQAEAP